MNMTSLSENPLTAMTKTSFCRGKVGRIDRGGLRKHN